MAKTPKGTAATKDATVLLNDYLTRVASNLSPNTHINYTWMLSTLHEFVGLPTDWDDVEGDQVEAFLARPRRTATGRPARRVVQKELSIIRTFFAYLMDRGALTFNPMVTVEKPRGVQPEPRGPMPDDHWIATWTSNDTTLEDKLWLGLGYFCGLRRQEMATIAPGGVRTRAQHPDPGSLTFFRKGGTKRAGISYASIIAILRDSEIGLPHLAKGGEEWMDLLEVTARFREDQVFLLAASEGGTTADGQRIYDRFRKLQLRAGISSEELSSPHNLRHSAATNLALCGVENVSIQRQLSHSSANMTEHYITTAGQDLTRWFEREKRLRARVEK